MFSKVKKYIINHKIEIGILLVILLLASFMRLYRISDYMTFLGDEGRDAIVAKDILHGHFTLLGPRASAGDFFLGPVYYYLMAPFLLLSNYDPVGPAIMVALFGIVTVFLVYYVGKHFFNRDAALIGACLYAVSPLVIAYSRSSWNPNLMPFASLILIYLLYKAVTKQSLKLFLFIGFVLGIAIQLHYLTTILFVVVFFYVLFGDVLKSKKDLAIRLVKHYGLILAGFFVTVSPFLLFELKHGFPNTKAIFKFVISGNNSEGYAIGQSFTGNILDVFFRIFGRLVTKFPPPEQVKLADHTEIFFWQASTIILGILAIVFIIKAKDKFIKLLLILWLFFGIFLFAFYRKPIYDYYLGFIFPLPFLLTGNFLSQLPKIEKLRKIPLILSISIFVVLFLLNDSGAPFLFPANKQKDQAKNIAEFVISKTGDMPYNFALLTHGNSDHVYRYFLDIENHTPVTIKNIQEDPQRKSVTSQLMIVCEYPNCSPLGDSLWEVAGFGRAEIAGQWQVPNVTIFRLVHYKGQ